MTERIYAIGDIHGQIGMLETALTRIAADGRDQEEIIFLGDYVDHGPDSRAVIETIRQGIVSGEPWTPLKGPFGDAYLGANQR